MIKRERIGITVGDPAGIGPEIVVKSLLRNDIYENSIPVVYSHKKALERVLQPNILLKKINNPLEAEGINNVIEYIEPEEELSDFEFGKVQSNCGKASYNYISMAIEDALKGNVWSVTTGPINKEAIKAAKINFIGHTEIFGEKTNSIDPLTMFEVRGLRVFFLTRHMSLKKACESITKERIVDYIKRCTEALRKIDSSDNIMAIAALNPHGGEHGLFGDEEEKYIKPAIEEALKMGYKVAGPIGADSVFHQALIGKYGSVLSLYHDQGHIATKTLDFHKVVSLTLGLPFLRTSVDHGTAFDIAGKNEAGSVSMEEAILIAIKYAKNFINE
ncbi:4-hydroxythreonine-4-phosphate dehydrogenase PdxA [Brachyspira catarrhinii]|uniref:4-hydroxythreonine-4-phosphate dehydrogenase PdxA n=1 Tax=Brachyspira catarrhinii TaxID=2528966 RepID=A0ABY2TQG0_9SPIR|nr:4-hydroxythreonine-4-phosphate dehydrogenase PdxA [Brachyspira catarrhinii]TKZ35088.1 4-hydroxythreonine-4-phosphate dehydrogenase PdxA [Brachyspira catarrhinii]